MTGFVELSDGRLAPASHGEGASGVSGEDASGRWVKTAVLDKALVATGVKFKYGGINNLTVLPLGDDKAGAGEDDGKVTQLPGLGAPGSEDGPPEAEGGVDKPKGKRKGRGAK